MLSTLLGQLQSYFSKYFVIGFFCPVLCFAFLNGLTGYVIFPPWRHWVDNNILSVGVGRGAFVVTSLTIGLVLAAYVLSSLSTFLRQLLEGRWWNFLSELFIPTQKKRREILIGRIHKARSNLIDLNESSKWENQLLEARKSGVNAPKPTTVASLTPEQLETDLEELEKVELQNDVIDASTLRETVNKLSTIMEENSVDANSALEKQHRRLLALFKFAKERAQSEYSRLLNELHSSFGAHEIEPTKMGNIANTIQSYALRRYQCNLEAVWSNLQRVVQRDEKANTALQESKTQLDFLVGCCWLTIGWSAIWSVAFVAIEQSRIGFLGAAIGGPTIAYIWYRVAAEQYRSFADVAMTTLDSFRFDLLQEMRLDLPYDFENERFIWQSLDQLNAYQSHDDRAEYTKKSNFRYVKTSHHE